MALADKLDTLVGFWAIGEKPTGSGDPYQLRRAALGVIRIVIENDLRLGLVKEFEIASKPIEAAIANASTPRASSVGNPLLTENANSDGSEVRSRSIDLLAFFAERLKVYLRDKGARHDLIDAVLSLGGQDDLALIVKRVDALGDS